MNWLDVAGPPGVGKSTLCDPLWGPHQVAIEDRLPPADWHDFINEIGRLFHLIREHPTLPAAVRMTRRSVRKMATVARMQGDGPYIQTGLVQRGLGFGWRLNHLGKPLDELRHFFRLMPVSCGVAFLETAPDVIEARNRARVNDPRTAHENRDFMVPLMLPAIEVAFDELSNRGVPVTRIDTGQDIGAARRELVAFATENAGHAPAVRSGCEVEALSPPYWWR